MAARVSVCWNNDDALPRFINCFGIARVEWGNIRVPKPPAKITGAILPMRRFDIGLILATLTGLKVGDFVFGFIQFAF